MEELIRMLVAEYAGTFAILAGFTVPWLVELCYTHIWQPTTRFLNSVVVFIIAIGTTFLAWPLSKFVAFGFLAEAGSWWVVLLWGVGAGAVAQWAWANIDVIYTVIRFLSTFNFEVFKLKRNSLLSPENKR